MSSAATARRFRACIAGVLVAVTLTLASGCASSHVGNADETVGANPVIYPLSLRYHGISTVSDIAYGTDPLQRLDVCLPQGAKEHRSAATSEPTGTATAAGPNGSERNGTRSAILMIHGGSWSHGDKATAAYRAVCKYFAASGFVVFNVDYRLAPTDPYPAGLDDVRRALDWVFQPSNLAAYGVDSSRVGVFGGSAGGNLAALLAVEDHDSSAYANGNRIRAVAELSGPTDLTRASTGSGGVSTVFQRRQLLYLDCTSYDSCPAARKASPLYGVTQRTAPFFIGASTDEFIPQWESRRFSAALRRKGTSVTFVSVRGTAHSIAQMDRVMSERLVSFFRAHLG